MTHANELLEWVVKTITGQFGIRVAQLWKYQHQSGQQGGPELLALALADVSAPMSILASSPVSALVKSMTGPQKQLAPQTVDNVFPNYLAILLRRRGLTHCTGYCVGKDLDLPLEKPHQLTRSKLILLLFLGEPPQGPLIEVSSFLEQALMIAEKRGLLRIHHVVQWNSSTAQLSSPLPLEILIPRRTENTTSNPLTTSLAITDKSARRFYDAIDDYSNVRALAYRIGFTTSETIKALQILLNQQRIELYEPREQKEPEEPPVTSNNAVDCYNKGNALFARARYQEALEAYEQTLHLDPNYVIAYNGMGDALLQLGRSEEAEEAYKQAVLRSIKRIR
jgi:hypothetical protein